MHQDAFGTHKEMHTMFVRALEKKTRVFFRAVVAVSHTLHKHNGKHDNTRGARKIKSSKYSARHSCNQQQPASQQQAKERDSPATLVKVKTMIIRIEAPFNFNGHCCLFAYHRYSTQHTQVHRCVSSHTDRHTHTQSINSQ